MMTIKRQRSGSAGFSLIESVFAIFILTGGLLALAGLFAQAISTTQFAQNDQIAKQKAREALESVYSARNDSQLPFDSIQNVSQGGIYNDGFGPLYVPGTNGLVGTTSDTGVLDFVRLPGADGLVHNTSADTIIPLSNFQRQILIETTLNSDGTVNTSLRKITVTVRVTEANLSQRDYSVGGFISTFP